LVKFISSKWSKSGFIKVYNIKVSQYTISWTMIVVHNRDQLEVYNVKVCQYTAFEIKVCCLSSCCEWHSKICDIMSSYLIILSSMNLLQNYTMALSIWRTLMYSLYCGHGKQVDVFPYLKTRHFVCYCRWSKSTTGITVQWKLNT